MLLCAEGLRERWECYGASESTESTERSDRECARIEVVNYWFLSVDVGIVGRTTAKFKSPESHRSDFGGERKPISNSDQIRSAQKWRLSIPPDSSRRDEAPAPNRVKIGHRTSPHAPPEVLRKSLISTEKALSEFSQHSGFIREDYALWKTKDEGHGREMNRKTIGQIRQCIGHERGTTVAEQTSEFQRATGRGQKKRPENRSQEGGHRGQEKRRDKKNCPRNKAPDQSSEAATTAMMAVDESDVLLAASADEESDWISDSGIAYHLCRDREVFSKHVACEGLVRMANDAIVGKGQSTSRGTLRVSKGNRRSCRRRKTGRLYRLRENVQTGELLSDIVPVVLARWMDEEATVAQRHAKQAQEYLMDVLERSTVEQERKEMLWDTCGSLVRHEKVQPVQDVHEEAQRRETESMHNDRRDVAETSLFRSRSVAVISPVVHTREERWSHDDLQSDSTGGSAEKCNPWGITGSTQHVAVCRGAERDGSAMVLVRAQRALRDLTESVLELVAVRGEQD
ncbi:hypothetical protein Acr_29g0001880 [Actinidia rufa]|uniref:Uncharacterized protein n=1 Tax=Actinidia rufa TaxID=165716 RepID=A0A7J0HD47_9ERIC|nr:hypothetical protein Acr_29g0001880 [Actinidia rufa]